MSYFYNKKWSSIAKPVDLLGCTAAAERNAPSNSTGIVPHLRLIHCVVDGKINDSYRINWLGYAAPLLVEKKGHLLSRLLGCPVL
jgi:hypothetical protein